MTRKLSTALVLALVLVMALSVAVFAQDSTSGTPDAPQNGTGYRSGRSGDSGAGVGQAANGNGQGMNFVDVEGDGICDHFVDTDNDGICDDCAGQGGQMMGQRNNRGQSDDATGTTMRRGGRGDNGQHSNGQRGGGRGNR